MSTTATAELVNVAGASEVALNGYDPVAFFTDGTPTRAIASNIAIILAASLSKVNASSEYFL
ncbi:hypothetical protein OAS39_08655 [Pirellulales bacterium]|nr:hypothetical protein [Pirellulales bacterium]